VSGYRRKPQGIALTVALMRLSRLDGVAAIPLSSGGFAVVDTGVADELRRWTWRCDRNGCAVRTTSYNRRNIAVYMHRQLMGLRPGDQLEVIHRNQISLDNRRCNLVVVSKFRSKPMDRARAAHHAS
jgi:hypothetical protein